MVRSLGPEPGARGASVARIRFDHPRSQVSPPRAILSLAVALVWATPSAHASDGGGLRYCFVGRSEEVRECEGGRIRALYYAFRLCDCENRFLPDAEERWWLVCSYETCFGRPPTSCTPPAPEPIEVLPCDLGQTIESEPCSGWNEGQIAELRRLQGSLRRTASALSNTGLEGLADPLIAYSANILEAWNDPQSPCRSRAPSASATQRVDAALEGLARIDRTQRELVERLRALGAPRAGPPPGAVLSAPARPAAVVPPPGTRSRTSPSATPQGGDGLPPRRLEVGQALPEEVSARIDADKDGVPEAVVIREPDGGEVVYHDDDGDGLVDWIEENGADGGTTLLTDTDGDGHADSMAVIPAGGGPPKYFRIPPAAETDEARGEGDDTDWLLLAADEVFAAAKSMTPAFVNAAKWLDHLGGLFSGADGSPKVSKGEELADDAGAGARWARVAAAAAGTAATGAGLLRVALDPGDADERRFEIAKYEIGLATEILPKVAEAEGDILKGIPDAQAGTLNAAFGELSASLQGRAPTPSRVFAPVADWLGKSVGMGEAGTMALDFNAEGQLSASDLRTRYGPVKGTMRAVWYYLLEDLYRNAE